MSEVSSAPIARAVARLTWGAVLVAALLCVAAGPQAEEPTYLSQLPDLPLMPGLSEIEEAGIAFDKPDGRIVEAYAGGSVDPPALWSFYRETLPQLGWRLAGPDSFAREGERLRLEVLGAEAGLTLRFVLTPE